MTVFDELKQQARELQDNPPRPDLLDEVPGHATVLLSSDNGFGALWIERCFIVDFEYYSGGPAFPETVLINRVLLRSIDVTSVFSPDELAEHEREILEAIQSRQRREIDANDAAAEDAAERRKERVG